MIAEIASAAAGLKAASELGALMLKIKVDSAITDKVIEAQATIFSAQSAMLELQAKHQELLDENSALKKQLIEIEDWKTESQKYALTEIEFRTFVFTMKPELSDSTPAHWLCSECYQNKKKSILQRMGHNSKGGIYLCHHCKNELLIPGQ